MEAKKIMMAAAIVACGTAMMAAPSCDGVLFDSSLDGSTGYYGVGYDNEWWPSLPGAPLVSPVYWGGAAYPGSWRPAVVPPGRPVARPPLVNAGSGNVRPGNSGVRPTPPSRPTVPTRPGGNNNNSVVPPAGTILPGEVTGGQPGVVMPPEGSGMRPGRR